MWTNKAGPKEEYLATLMMKITQTTFRHIHVHVHLKLVNEYSKNLVGLNLVSFFKLPIHVCIPHHYFPGTCTLYHVHMHAYIIDINRKEDWKLIT